MNFSTYILIPTLKKHSCAQTFKFTCKTAHKIQFQFQQKVTSCKWIHALHKEPLINANLKAGNQKTEKAIVQSILFPHKSHEYCWSLLVCALVEHLRMVPEKISKCKGVLLKRFNCTLIKFPIIRYFSRFTVEMFC